ncbi:MAG TPA: hypothetical protein VGQ26_26760 [Streptosporangiaceae bacterium]|nr:hypothetical protein [Streptosporangiaceae bacterium]
MRISLAGRRRLGALAATDAIILAQVVVQTTTSAPAAAIPGLQVAEASTAMDSMGVKTQDVDCPPGTRVLGGGAALIGNPSTKVFLTEMRPLHAWTYRVTAAEMAPGWDGRWILTAYAICSAPLRGWELKTGNSGTDASDFKTTFTYGCSEHKKAFSAGGRVNVPAGQQGQVGLTMVRPDGPLTIGRASARVAPGGFWDPWSVDSYAICAYPVPNQQNAGQLSPNSWGYATCPSGPTPNGLGGGAGTVDLHKGYLQDIQPYQNGVYVQMTDLPDGGIVAQVTCSD